MYTKYGSYSGISLWFFFAHRKIFKSFVAMAKFL